MISDFMKYKFIEKTKSELATDEIVNNLSRKLWNDSGYNVAYFLGIVNYLKAMATQMRSHDSYSKKDLMMCIACIRDGTEIPDEIKKLVDIVLEELKDKEN
jgi:hypothetical protein